MNGFKNKVFNLIREDDVNGFWSKIFDGLIIFLISLNVLLVIVDTFPIPKEIASAFYYVEVVSVIIFSIEYLARVWTSDLMYPEANKLSARIKYIFSFMALIDLLAILPFYIPFIIVVDLRVLRILRLFRLVRLMKFNRYTSALSNIGGVIKNKSSQLISSIFVVLLLMIISSVIMYSLENPSQPDVFKNAFSGFWWTLNTITTVGYGDIYPVTTAGRILSGIISILGIGLVAVPTGIISAGFVEAAEDNKNEQSRMLSIKSDLIILQDLFKSGMLSESEYDAQRAIILNGNNTEVR